jgi:hypothetical protein
MSASVATAQPRTDADGYRNARRLGGTTSFYRPALTNPASLKKMTATKGVADDVRKVLSDAGISDAAEAVVNMLNGGAPSTKGGSCVGATPADGVLLECDFPVGATLEWMAYRPNIGRGDRTPGTINKFRWSGAKPFGAFLFRVTNSRGVYTFVVPKPCGNLSLMNFQEARRETPAPPPPPPPAPRIETPPPPPPPPAPRVEPPPPPAQAPAPAMATVKSSPFFFDILAGKDRRTRDLPLKLIGGGQALANAGAGAYAQCEPLLGLKFGAGKRFSNDVEVNGAVGLGLSLVSDKAKVRQHALFADLELNKYIGRGYIGTGFTLWDFTNDAAPGVLLHFGVPLNKSDSHPVHFVGQGRIFFGDDIKDNYLLWGGVRVHF